MNNKIACIDIVVISMFLVCISEIEFLFLYNGNIYLRFFNLIIYYVLSLAGRQDKYYFNYRWNLKHNRFVIVQLTWMDQVAIVRNLTCCQCIRFKKLSFFFILNGSYVIWFS